MAPAQTRLRPDPNTAAIRCYGQGLGDCFLLAFPRAGNHDEPCYVVIDCGVAFGTPDEEERMREVVADIDAATGGRLDVLALTHQHYDHVIGFVHAEERWKQIRVGQLFLPWTEKPGDGDAETIGKAALRFGQAADQAAERAAGLTDAGPPVGLRLAGGLLATGSESFGISAAEGIKRGWKIALDRCPEEDRRVYCEPGDVLPLDGTGVSAYVLGPPRPTDRAGEPLVGRTGRPLVFVLEDRHAMYSYAQFGLAPDGAGHHATLHANAEVGSTSSLASALLGSGPDGDADFDRYCPFDRTLQIDWDDALAMPFFWQQYASKEDWRRVDYDWLDCASDLALRAGDFTNNISLVLAFELPRSKDVLLFVGDAQVGNWLSWHKIDQWRHKDPGVASSKADMDALLARVAFYKVGHHGSHNATIREQGLEKMRDGLIAYIPVSVPVAHDILGYCPMPFYPVLLALQQKAHGQVYLANGRLLTPLPTDAGPLPPPGVAINQSGAMLREKVRKRGTAAAEEIEAAVPLWIQFAFDDKAPA